MPSGRDQMPGWQGCLPQRPKPNTSKPHPTLSLLSCAKRASPQPLFRAQAPYSGGLLDSSQMSHNQVIGKSCPLRLQNIFRRKPLPSTLPAWLEPPSSWPQLSQGPPRCHLPPIQILHPAVPRVLLSVSWIASLLCSEPPWLPPPPEKSQSPSRGPQSPKTWAPSIVSLTAPPLTPLQLHSPPCCSLDSQPTLAPGPLHLQVPLLESFLLRSQHSFPHLL